MLSLDSWKPAKDPTSPVKRKKSFIQLGFIPFVYPQGIVAIYFRAVNIDCTAAMLFPPRHGQMSCTQFRGSGHTSHSYVVP